MAEDKVVLMVKRRTVIAVITAFAVLFISNLASFQYANYVDRRSNQKLCGIITLNDETYKTFPPPSNTGKAFAKEFEKLRNDKSYKCK